MRLYCDLLGLIPKLQTETKQIHLLFNQGLLKAHSEIAFIPSEYKEKLLLINDAVLDKTKIFKNPIFYKYFKQLYPEKDIICYDLLYTSEKLCKIDIYGFSVQGKGLKPPIRFALKKSCH